MDLFEEIITKDNEQNQIVKMNKNRDVVYEKLVIKESLERQMSSLTQYFLASFILVDSNGILDIPVFNTNIQDIVLKEIAPHFNKVNKVTTNNQVILRVQNVRESSKTQFLDQLNNHRMNAIVNDIYANGSPCWRENFRSKEYHVNLEVVKKSIDNDILSMWNFFEHSFVRAHGNLVILPSEWAFDESFKDRIAVQSFAGVCNSMTVTVNQENNIITSIFIN